MAKGIISFILILMFSNCIGQSLKRNYELNTNSIDSIVERIEKSIHNVYYMADSSFFIYDKDSNTIDGKSIEFYYSNRRGNDLIKVDELLYWPDTAFIDYYYKSRKLVKIDYYVFKGNRLKVEIYYKDGQVIDVKKNIDLDYKINYDKLYALSKKYLAYKSKIINSNLIIN